MDRPLFVNIGNRPLRIAIGVGHANTSGGGMWAPPNPPANFARERPTAARTVNEFLKLARASHGFDVRCYTPQDGLGMYPGPLNAAANEVIKWLNQGWRADILWEEHSQGTGEAHRGSFVIYPDGAGLRSHRANPGDKDLDVLWHGQVMAGILARAVGTVVWRQGVMSERETGVGRQGSRLGLFGEWSHSYFVNNSFRILSETVHHTNPQDQLLMRQADHPRKRARGILDAMVSLARVRGQWTFPYRIGAAAPAPPPSPPPAPGPGPTPPPVDGDGYGLPLPDSVIRERFPLYDPNPAGRVSAAWADFGKQTGVWPAFVDVQQFGDERFFWFENGLVLIADDRGRVRMAKGDDD